jgi:hypothetical protein
MKCTLFLAVLSTNFAIEFWNWFDSVVFFVFHIIFYTLLLAVLSTNFAIEFWNWFDSVVFFVFHIIFYTLLLAVLSTIFALEFWNWFDSVVFFVFCFSYHFLYYMLLATNGTVFWNKVLLYVIVLKFKSLFNIKCLKINDKRLFVCYS